MNGSHVGEERWGRAPRKGNQPMQRPWGQKELNIWEEMRRDQGGQSRLVR